MTIRDNVYTTFLIGVLCCSSAPEAVAEWRVDNYRRNIVNGVIADSTLYGSVIFEEPPRYGQPSPVVVEFHALQEYPDGVTIIATPQNGSLVHAEFANPTQVISQSISQGGIVRAQFSFEFWQIGRMMLGFHVLDNSDLSWNGLEDHTGRGGSIIKAQAYFDVDGSFVGVAKHFSMKEAPWTLGPSQELLRKGTKFYDSQKAPATLLTSMSKQRKEYFKVNNPKRLPKYDNRLSFSTVAEVRPVGGDLSELELICHVSPYKPFSKGIWYIIHYPDHISVKPLTESYLQPVDTGSTYDFVFRITTLREGHGSLTVTFISELDVPRKRLYESSAPRKNRNGVGSMLNFRIGVDSNKDVVFLNRRTEREGHPPEFFAPDSRYDLIEKPNSARKRIKLRSAEPKANTEDKSEQDRISHDPHLELDH